jgi:acyl carrier protein
MIRATLITFFDTPPQEGGENYIEAGYISSLGIIRLIVNIERRFGIEILVEDMLAPDFKTLDGLVRIIEEKTR